MTCFAVVWTTWAYDDTCSILSSYRFRRRRVCLSFLLILPYERPIGSGLIWETIWLVIEARHCMKPASSELISIPTFPFSRAIAVRQLTFVVLPDNIFWNSYIYDHCLLYYFASIAPYCLTHPFVKGNKWFPHRLSKRQSLTAVLLRTPITQFIFFNQGIPFLICNILLILIQKLYTFIINF